MIPVALLYAPTSWPSRGRWSHGPRARRRRRQQLRAGPCTGRPCSPSFSFETLVLTRAQAHPAPMRHAPPGVRATAWVRIAARLYIARTARGGGSLVASHRRHERYARYRDVLQCAPTRALRPLSGRESACGDTSGVQVPRTPAGTGLLRLLGLGGHTQLGAPNRQSQLVVGLDHCFFSPDPVFYTYLACGGRLLGGYGRTKKIN